MAEPNTLLSRVVNPERTAMSELPAYWYLYMIETVQGKLYTGITTDTERRFKQHQSGRGGAKFFRSDPPLRLRLRWIFPDRSSASKEEYRIKQLTRKQKLLLISASGGEIEPLSRPIL